MSKFTKTGNFYYDSEDEYDEYESDESEDIDPEDVIELNLEDVKRAVGLMAENYNEKTSNIKPGHKLYDSFEYIQNISRHLDDIFEETNKMSNKYSDFISIIMKELRPSEIKADTLGSFMFGCFQSSYGDIEKSCSVMCDSNSINNPLNISDSCKEQIIVQISDKIVSGKSRFKRSDTSNTKSHRGYIFLNPTFEAFSKDEITQFEDYGLLMLQGMTTNYSQHHLVFKMRTLDKLPQIEDVPIYASRSERKRKNRKRGSYVEGTTVDDVLDDVTSNMFEYVKSYLQSEDFTNLLSYGIAFIFFIGMFLLSLGGGSKRSNLQRIGM